MVAKLFVELGIKLKIRPLRLILGSNFFKKVQHEWTRAFLAILRNFDLLDHPFSNLPKKVQITFFSLNTVNCKV